VIVAAQLLPTVKAQVRAHQPTTANEPQPCGTDSASTYDDLPQQLGAWIRPLPDDVGISVADPESHEEASDRGPGLALGPLHPIGDEPRENSAFGSWRSG
jgi:hypothetical protein